MLKDAAYASYLHEVLHIGRIISCLIAALVLCRSASAISTAATVAVLREEPTKGFEDNCKRQS